MNKFVSLKNIFYPAILFLCLSILSSCGDVNQKDRGLSEEGAKARGLNPNFPMDIEDRRRIQRGSLAGDYGISLFGNNKPVEEEYSDVTGGVNAYLWKASLDVMSFMPLASADAVGGVIITDWYESEDAKGERIKANVRINTKELRASGVEVSLFKQKLSGGNWRDSKASKDLEEKLEEKILSKAREIKIEGKLL